jgi:signal transduction histidine kinase
MTNLQDALRQQLDIKEALRQVPLFSKLPEKELQWLCEQGTEVWREPGEVHRQEGAPADHVFVLLEGEIRITQQVGTQQLVLATYEPQTLFGELPVLMGQETYWASGIAVTRSRIFELPKEAFWRLLSTCSCVTASILSTMAQRMQNVQNLAQQREKLAALGTLAAGLAHEMNNPAAAVSRGAKHLQELWQDMPCLALKLKQQVTKEQLTFLIDLQCEAVKQAQTASLLDPLTQSDREDEMTDWLEAHNVSNCWQLAPILVGAGLNTAWLENVAQKLPADSLSPAIAWLTTSLTGVSVLNEIEHCSERISHLVQAIKDYSFMDRAPLQEVDVHQGLESTLTILSHKLKQGVVVNREYDAELPRINAYGGALNQVWTNLIDNAIDAMHGQGKIWVRTWREHDHISVEIADNGPGIPPAIQPRIFEPFFTTKGVGQGTGLGLDMTYRIVVGKHNGDISFISSPGDTRFRVRLPIG